MNKNGCPHRVSRRAGLAFNARSGPRQEPQWVYTGRRVRIYRTQRIRHRRRQSLLGEARKNTREQCPNRTGLTMAGGLLTGFVDAAYDDISPEQLWQINVGAGFNALPLCRNSKSALVNTLELREMRNQTTPFVFEL